MTPTRVESRPRRGRAVARSCGGVSAEPSPTATDRCPLPHAGRPYIVKRRDAGGSSFIRRRRTTGTNVAAADVLYRAVSTVDATKVDAIRGRGVGTGKHSADWGEDQPTHGQYGEGRNPSCSPNTNAHRPIERRREQTDGRTDDRTQRERSVGRSSARAGGYRLIRFVRAPALPSTVEVRSRDAALSPIPPPPPPPSPRHAVSFGSSWFVGDARQNADGSRNEEIARSAIEGGRTDGRPGMQTSSRPRPAHGCVLNCEI